MDSISRARRGLVVFFAVLIPVSLALQYQLVHAGDPISKHLGLVFLLMWVPAIASIVARLALHEGAADISLASGGPQRYTALAWLYPVVMGLPAYVLAWISGLAGFSPPMLDRIGVHVPHGAARLAVLLLLGLTLGAVSDIIASAGEEIGWRGYLLVRLIDARVPTPVLTSGIVWAAWHAPLVLVGAYASGGTNPALSMTVFTVNVVAFGYITAFLRLRSGSIWPAVIAHASWNAVIQGVFDASTTNPGAWVGEAGTLLAGFNVIGAWILSRGTWAIRRTPADRSPDEVWHKGGIRFRAGDSLSERPDVP
jgi:uncharacterized protein